VPAKPAASGIVSIAAGFASSIAATFGLPPKST
jgi:CRISPR/Cas system-associated protein Cas5 (RAMP superfamily)